MPIEAVKIPQNVYVEDRIIGPVTLKQLAITGIGAGISYMIYATATKLGASLPVLVAAWVPAVIAGAFAFLKINDLSLFNIILLMIEGMQKPKQRYWSSHGGISINLITRQATKEMTDANTKITDNANRLAEITRQLEKRQEAMDRLASHEEQKPDNVDGIRTRFEDAITKPDENAVHDESGTSTLPVNPNRVSPDGLDPLRSIDGIASDIKAYEKLVARAS